MPMQPDDIINDLLSRSVTRVIPRELAWAKLNSGKKLRIYFGIDPTGDKLHLGHAVPLRKLKKFQELGHEVILVIGSFTAMIGDPSGRENAREPLTELEVKKNFATYKKQAKLVLDLDKVKIRFNNEWLGRLKPKDIINLASSFSVQQLLERDMFQQRIKYQKPISVHELMYPLLVGYDSVVLDVDGEIGGNDQLFNMLCGRTLQQIYGKRDKFVLTTKLLEGTDGRKMSKTYNNTIYLTDPPNDMYGKIMSIKDELIVPYFELCTDWPIAEIKEVETDLNKGDNPRGYKAQLAFEIVKMYHGVKAAQAAEVEFNRVYKNKELPREIPQIKLSNNKKTMPLTELLVYVKLAQSKSEGQRLIKQKGVKINGEIIDDWKEEIQIKPGLLIQVGTRKFIKLV